MIMVKLINYSLKNIKNKNEIIKLIGYASEDILSYKLIEDNLSLEINENADENYIISNLNKLIFKFNDMSVKEECIFNTENKHRKFTNTKDVLNSKMIHIVDDGLITFKGLSVRLLKYFDDKFLEIARLNGCIERIYPVLLPIKAYLKTSYPRNSPQYTICCCELEENIDKLKSINEKIHENSLINFLKPPKAVLSPAACFHVYDEFEDSIIDKPLSLTFKQSVFRNEGRFNWQQYGCLKSYTIRELVFIGSKEYVEAMRMKILNAIIDFMKEIDILGKINTAADPFIIPEIQQIKDIQMLEKSKYELRLLYDTNKELSCASFNLHGVSFAKSFGFKVNQAENTVSACVGVGLERWVLAFLCQFGIDEKLWPIILN